MLAGVRARVFLGELADGFLAGRLVPAGQRGLDLGVARLGDLVQGLRRGFDLSLEQARVVLGDLSKQEARMLLARTGVLEAAEDEETEPRAV